MSAWRAGRGARSRWSRRAASRGLVPDGAVRAAPAGARPRRASGPRAAGGGGDPAAAGSGRHPARGSAPALRAAGALLAVGAVVAAGGPAAGAAPVPGAPAQGNPRIELSDDEAGAGGSVTVTGSGWGRETLLTLLICGQNMADGTNSCANADGRAVTSRADGTFRTEIPVAEPPDPCPCVVHAATVTGRAASADAPLEVAGHPVEPVPEREESAARLGVLVEPRLDGTGGVLNWFGAPPQRTLVVTVGNLGTAPAKDPVFELGTSHGVFAPEWDRQQWRGTIPPGGKEEVELPVELSYGAHGDYLVSLRHDGTLLAEQPWRVGRPWGVVLFWALLFTVVPVGLFRIGMAVVDRLPAAPPRMPWPGAGRRRPAPPARQGAAEQTR